MSRGDACIVYIIKRVEVKYGSHLITERGTSLYKSCKLNKDEDRAEGVILFVGHWNISINLPLVVKHCTETWTPEGGRSIEGMRL